MILVVCSKYLERTQCRKDVRMRQHIEEVRAHEGSGVQANRAPIGFGIVTGRFQCLPTALQEDTLLRIEDLGFARTKAEEPGIELIDAFEHATSIHEIRI